MSKESPDTWPLLPAHSAYAVHGLCMAIADLIQEEGGAPSRRALLKAAGIATAAELFAGELAHFFSTRMGEDHELLEAIEDRYLEARRKA